MKALKSLLIMVALCALPFLSIAQPPDPPGGSTPTCGDPFGSPCPIDGGVSFLIAAGLALGGKKAYDLGRKKA